MSNIVFDITRFYSIIIRTLKATEQLTSVKQSEAYKQPASLSVIYQEFEGRVTTILGDLEPLLEVNLESEIDRQSVFDSTFNQLLLVRHKHLIPMADYCEAIVSAGFGRRSIFGREARRRFPDITASDYHQAAKIYNQVASLDFMVEMALCLCEPQVEAYSTFFDFCDRQAAWHKLRADYHFLVESASGSKAELAVYRQQLKEQARELEALSFFIEALPKARPLNLVIESPDVVIENLALAKPLSNWLICGQKPTPLKPRGLK